MYYKHIHNNSNGDPIYAWMDDDGNYAITCDATYQPFIDWCEQGNTPVPMDAE